MIKKEQNLNESTEAKTGVNTVLGAVTYERLLDDDDKPFNKLEDADHLAEIWYPEKVIVATKDGDKLCKTDRSNAWQPDGAYSYFFYEVKE